MCLVTVDGSEVQVYGQAASSLRAVAGGVSPGGVRWVGWRPVFVEHAPRSGIGEGRCAMGMGWGERASAPAATATATAAAVGEVMRPSAPSESLSLPPPSGCSVGGVVDRRDGTCRSRRVALRCGRPVADSVNL